MAIGYCYKPLIIFLLCVAISSAQINRVMTYNIHHGEGTDSIIDIKRIAQVINKWSPELVALQEVDNGPQYSERILMFSVADMGTQCSQSIRLLDQKIENCLESIMESREVY